MSASRCRGRRAFAVASALLVLLGACAADPANTGGDPSSATSDGVAAQQPVALIPRDAVFGNPNRTQARISPDGKMLSWLAPLAGVMNIFVAPADDPGAARAVTNDTGRGIRSHSWSRAGKHLLYTQDQGGNENFHVYAASVDSAEVRDLTPASATVRAFVEAQSDRLPHQVLVGMNDRVAELFDLYRVDVRTGERTLVLENPGFSSFMIDNNLQPRLGVREQDSGGARIELLNNGEWQPFAELNAEDMIAFSALGFDAADESFYTLDSTGRDTAALIRTELATGKREVLASHAKADIGSVLLHPDTREPFAYAVNHLRQQWFALTRAQSNAAADPMAGDLAFLASELAGDVVIVAVANHGDTLLLAADDAVAPSAYYRFDRSARKITELFVTRPQLQGAPLQPMQSLQIRSRDGLDLVSYLTLPPGSDTDSDGVPEAPLPMVLYVHGGPWARDEYGYNTVHQWLANRGYAVLSVNYRGSIGFGKSFTNAAVRQFAGKMHDDLIDGVNWAVQNKIANDEQIAIMGGSYGGYATLVGLTFTPDVFACGVDIVGPSSLITLIESFPAYWGPSLANSWFKFVGNPANEAERADLAKRSPITRVGDIKAPLLIGQGENDPRVTKLESDQLVAAMEAKGLPV
ncbi:MAG: alpha/beta fold hydrolase, partial [Pseudomonadales bacterium]